MTDFTNPGKKPIHRRVFLKGAFGVTMSLPFLDVLATRNSAYAADPSTVAPRYFICVRSGNGVAQAAGSEPEKFWPMDRGPLTREMLQRLDGSGDLRAVGELADYHDRLLVVDGCKYNYPGNGCGHSGGGNQCLTATPPSDSPSGNRSLATGESVDSRIQRILVPGDPEPLTLAAGRSSSYLDEVLSYAAPGAGETNGRLRAAERNPWEVYKSIFGTPGSNSGDYLEQRVALQRQSVNDVLREQIDWLKTRPGLSQADQNRIALHQDAIRDLEVRMMECHLPDTVWGTLESHGDSGAYSDPVNVETTTTMMMEVVALAFACDLKRAATLQIGNGNDQTVYDINGPDYPFHWISHRIQGDGSAGSAPTIDNAADLHHQIDRLHARWFKVLLDKLSQYTTATGTLLDDTVALWTNDLANGIGHGYRNVPLIVAGSAGGRLKNGLYIDARDTGTKDGDGWVSHSQFFNTVLNAVGVGEVEGQPVTDFGHAGGNGHSAATGGEIAGMKA